MKNKRILILLCAVLVTTAGCGAKTPQSSISTEQAVETETELPSSMDIEYDVMDYVTLGDYSNIEITLKEDDYKVTEEDKENYANQMISYYLPYEDDESKTVVEAGDVVKVDYVGKKDGVAFDGGSAEDQLIDTANNSNPTTGSGYIDGFAEGLIGGKVGETIEHPVTFPQDYQNEELAGADAVFEFTIKAIEKAVTKEDLTDEIVQETFQIESVEEFDQQMSEFLESQAEVNKETDMRTAVIDQMVEKSTISGFPEGLLESRVEEYISQFTKQYCSDGTTLADYLAQNGTTEEQFRQEMNTYMEENLKQEFVFEAIAKQENITFDEDGFKEYVDNLLSNGGFSSEEDIYLTYGTSVEAGKAYLEKIYLGNLACEKIVKTAKVTFE